MVVGRGREFGAAVTVASVVGRVVVPGVVVVVVVRGAPPGTVIADGGPVAGGGGGAGGTGTVCGPTVVGAVGGAVVVVVRRGSERSDVESRPRARIKRGTVTITTTPSTIVNHTHALVLTRGVCRTRR